MRELAEIVRTVQGHFIHEFWASSYGVTLTDEARETVFLRSGPELLAAARSSSERVVTNCRGFTVVTVELLRARGCTARARCGFGRYFVPGKFEDHWVVEYRDGSTWRLADAQIDAVQQAALGVSFDLLDLPAGQFLTGPEAWRLARSGEAAFDQFGLSVAEDLHGDWFVAGNVLRDRVSVDHDVAVLPWDAWEPMPAPGEAFSYELFDRLADGSEPVAAPAKVHDTRRDETVTLRP